MSNDTDIHKLVKDQFGPVAAAYTTSVGHANPEALQKVVELAQPKPTDRILDVATGAGHTALAFGPFVTEVVAFDLTSEMLEETARNAEARGLKNIITLQGQAEAIPFPENSFDIVTCRVAPHHFANIEKAVSEMARVVKPGGRVLVVDTSVPEDKQLDLEINYIEKRRDPSHVRNYSESAWKKMFQTAGISVTHTEFDQYTEQGRMNFEKWTTRMRTPNEAVEELSNLFRSASEGLKNALEIEIVGSNNSDIFFTLPKVTILGIKKA